MSRFDVSSVLVEVDGADFVIAFGLLDCWLASLALFIEFIHVCCVFGFFSGGFEFDCWFKLLYIFCVRFARWLGLIDFSHAGESADLFFWMVEFWVPFFVLGSICTSFFIPLTGGIILLFAAETPLFSSLIALLSICPSFFFVINFVLFDNDAFASHAFCSALLLCARIKPTSICCFTMSLSSC